jgi:hypothetical protein
MASQTVPGATVGDVQQALVEQFGARSVRPLTAGPNQASWYLRFSAKARANCSAVQTNTGVVVTMTHATPIFLWIVAVVGLVFFCVPGVIGFIMIILFKIIGSGMIGHQFPAFLNSVQRFAHNRKSTT